MNVKPIQYCIDESKFLPLTYDKKRPFSPIIPWVSSTYVYTEETPYLEHYKDCFFALTYRKGAWDSLRHYEIIASGCIPYFIDLEYCPKYVLHLMPKELLLKARFLKGVKYPFMEIDFDIFDLNEYYTLRDEIYRYAKNFLTTRYMAKHILDRFFYKTDIDVKKCLYIVNHDNPPYVKCLLLEGLKRHLGDENVTDIDKLEHLYKNYNGDIKKLYGKGMSYTKILDDVNIDRDNIEDRIKNREFDCIIYSNSHADLKYFDLVKEYYKDRIILICEFDNHHFYKDCKCYKDVGMLFMVEYDGQIFEEFDDYDFYLNKDYGGNDITYVLQTTTPGLMHEFAKFFPDCNAFNSLGYMKKGVDKNKLQDLYYRGTIFCPLGIYIKKKKIAFFFNNISGDIIFNYAHYNQRLLKNKSVIIILGDNNKSIYSYLDIENKFCQYFEVIYVKTITDINNVIKTHRIDYFYTLINDNMFKDINLYIPTIFHHTSDNNIYNKDNITNVVISNDINVKNGTSFKILSPIIDDKLKDSMTIFNEITS